MNKNHIIKYIGIALVSAFLGLTAASAETQNSWDQWSQETNAIVAAKMEAPWLRQGQAGTLQSVEFDVFPDGQIQNILFKALPGHPAYDLATKKTLRKLNVLPPLPSGFNGEKLRVQLDLVYAKDKAEAKRVIRKFRRKTPARPKFNTASIEDGIMHMIAMR